MALFSSRPLARERVHAVPLPQLVERLLGILKHWAEIAREVFGLANSNGEAVRPVTTVGHYAGAEGPVAPRPERSDLDLTKVESTGFSPCDWEDELREYVAGL